MQSGRSGKPGEPGERDFPVYKGENILPCFLTNEPPERGVPSSYVKPSIWRDPAVLPDIAYAFAEVTQAPVAVRFNPHVMAFRNSAVVFVPEPRVKAVPLDFLTQSVLFRWYFLIGLREGVAADYYCHIYPRTVEMLPWSDALIAQAAELEGLRTEWLAACERRYNARDALLASLKAADSETLRQRFARDKNLSIRWGDASAPGYHVVQLGRELFDVLGVNDERTADDLRRICSLFSETTLSQGDLMALPLPRSGSSSHQSIINDWNSRDLQAEADQRIAALDKIVAKAFGFSDEDVQVMRADIREDILFRRLQTRYPYQPKTVRGLMANLSRPGRFD